MNTIDKLPKSHVFNGKRYKIRWRRPPGRTPKELKGHKIDGLCSDPRDPATNRILYVFPDDTEENVVNTILHESLHAELWMLDEETITRVANSLSGLLEKIKIISKERQFGQFSNFSIT